jgi:hypothetical protein
VDPAPTTTKTGAQNVPRREATEVWLESPSYPPYEVSDRGRVRLGRRHLKAIVWRGGYCVRLNRYGYTAMRIDSLVADAFLGRSLSVSECYRTTLVHRNGDPSNCRASNLLVASRLRYPVADMRRASALLDAGVSHALIFRLTRVPKRQLSRYRARLREATNTSTPPGPERGAENP